MSLKIIDVAGLKNSGKTSVIENLVKELNLRGYKVGTLKKIHIPDFTIDNPGKDTFRHMQAGADFVISLAPKEITMIQRKSGQKLLSEILKMVPKETDFLICEELNEDRDDVYYIITLNKLESLDETLQVRSIGKNIIAISGVVSEKENKHDKYLIINTSSQTGINKLVDLIINLKASSPNLGKS